jgi:two-component system cell cycle sensor histidine kinase/response regulator CckA
MGRFEMKRWQLLDVLAAIAGMLSRGRVIDVDAALREIGEAVGVDRVYLFESSTEEGLGRLLCSQRFEWAAGSVSAEIDNPALQRLPYEDIGPDFERALRAGEVVASLTRDVEPTFRALLEPQGVLSVCIVPVMVEEHVWGFVGFDDCHEERVWSADEISVLRLIAAVLGGHYWREQMRSALATREAQYRYLLDNVDEVILEADADGRLTFLNRAWEKHFGFAVDDSLGRNLFDFADGEDAAVLRAAFEAAVEGTGPGLSREARFRTPDAERRWVQLSLRFQRDVEGRIAAILGTLEDVTERRWAEEALRRQQLEQSLSTLAGGIAHDLNNVLHGMLTAAEILARRNREDARSAELLSIITTGGERMADMTRQLMAYARGGVYETMLLDPLQLVEDALKIGRGKLPAHVQVELVALLDDVRVRGDRGQLFQVLLNLLVNAVEAMGDGGVLRIEVEEAVLAGPDVLVRERIVSEGSYVRISFVDQGHGIDPHLLPRIFEPFFSTKSQGRGLGLAAARGIVASHGGAISVESEVELGSTFHVLLPRVDAVIGRVHEPASSPEARGLVLLVDDEEAILRVTAEQLQDAGYRVLTARDGHSALALYDRYAAEIDAALVDYLMPGMDGAELVRALRARRRSLCVVLCSGYDRNLALTPELDDVPRLQKPFRLPAFLALLSPGAPGPPGCGMLTG